MLRAQTAAGASERTLRERSGALPQDRECGPCPTGCCTAGTWRDSLLPHAGPGLTHLPAGTRGLLLREKEVIRVLSVCEKAVLDPVRLTAWLPMHGLCHGQKQGGGSGL